MAQEPRVVLRARVYYIKKITKRLPILILNSGRFGLFWPSSAQILKT